MDIYFPFSSARRHELASIVTWYLQFVATVAAGQHKLHKLTCYYVI